MSKTIQIPKPEIIRNGRLITARINDMVIELDLAFTAEEALSGAIFMASRPHHVANILEGMGIKGTIRIDGQERKLNME